MLVHTAAEMIYVTAPSSVASHGSYSMHACLQKLLTIKLLTTIKLLLSTIDNLNVIRVSLLN